MLASLPRISPRLAIAIAFLLRGFVQGSWYPRIPGVVERLDVDPAQLGVIFFLLALGNIIAFSLAAKFVSRIGSPRTHMLFGVPFSLAVVVLSVVANTPQLAIAMLAFGLFAGGFDISSSVQGAVVERRTGKPIISMLYGMYSVGALAGSFSSGLITQAGISLAVQFIVIAIVAVPIVVLITASMLPDDLVPGTHAPRSRRLPALPPKVLLPLGLMIVCIALGEETINNWIALYLREDLGASPAIASLAYTAFAIATAIGRLLGDVVIARTGVDRTLMAGSVLAASGVGFGMAVNQPWAIILGYTLMGLGLSVVVPVTYRRANQIPGIPRASAVATVASIGFIGFLIGPLLIGTLADLTSLRIAISAIAVVLLGILVLTKLNPHPAIVPETAPAGSISAREGDPR